MLKFVPPSAAAAAALLLAPMAQAGTVVEIGDRAFLSLAGAGAVLVLAVAGLSLAALRQRRTLKHLAASERRLNLALEVSRDGLWDWDLVTGECYYSAQWYRSMGLDPARPRAHVSTWEDRIHPRDLEALKAKIARHRAGGSDLYESEHRVMHGDGRYHWHRVRAKVVAWTDSGRPAHMIGVESDVTERSRTDEALTASRAQLDAIFENSPAELFLKDADGRYLRISREFERRFGLRNEKVAGRLPEEVHYDSLAKFIREHDKEVLRTGEPSLREEHAWLESDGQEHVFLTLKFPTYDSDGRISGLGGIATDVTEMKRTQRELAERDRLLRLMYDNIPLLLAYVGRDLRVRVANREATEWYGRPLNRIIGERLEQVAGPAAWAQMRRDVERVLAGERVDLDGSREFAGGKRWVTGSLVPDFDESGELQGYCVMAVDISRRKRSEDAVKENERLLRLIYNNVPVMLAYVGADRRYRTANAACAEWFGRPLDRIIGRRVEDVVGPDAWPDVGPEIERALNGETVTVDGLRTYAAGARWVTGTVAPNFDDDGVVRGYCVTLADISERKQAEEKLKNSERRLRLVANNVPGMLTRVDADRRFTFINRSTEEWLGLPEEQVIGRHVRDVIGGPAYESFKPFIDRVLCGERVSFDLERTFQHARSRWTAGTLTPDFDERGLVRGYYSLVMDVTERKHAEDAARRAELRLLEQQRNQRAAVEQELDRVRDELVTKTRLATIGEVAASVAHDLRNPLGAIRNAKFYLSRKLPPGESKWREYLEVMEREIVAADRIIHDLMDMTREREPSRGGLDLEPALRQAYRRVGGGNGVGLEIGCDRRPFTLWVDAGQFARVLDNLMLNAIQAMGGRGRIRVQARTGEEEDVISISDTGEGVAAEIRERLFEPLVTDKAKGTGLGLAICRQIIERHGGQIRLARSDENGTDFRITLPRLAGCGLEADSEKAAGMGARLSAGRSAG